MLTMWWIVEPSMYVRDFLAKAFLTFQGKMAFLPSHSFTFFGTLQNLDSGLWTGPWTGLWRTTTHTTKRQIQHCSQLIKVQIKLKVKKSKQKYKSTKYRSNRYRSNSQIMRKSKGKPLVPRDMIVWHCTNSYWQWFVDQIQVATTPYAEKWGLH